ncbi:hypothetical protein ZIOFF_042444 [Zingiber officinale]|uniref:Homeobox domain-containing protein n=1 Tax=Zingiber officinale TaxID=94328 RepID=A0A8J5G1Q3_ZINOF|nr:hypothetical protein ZIOFF_042444 [Zingiber officinale]
MPQTPSTRWCPTAEQLMMLEEMYRNGIRTPSAPQIQQITAYLSLYGKIEGKNVFYWFQNHKAREGQKLHRRLGRQHQVDLLPRSEGSSTPVLQLNNRAPKASFPNYQVFGFHSFLELINGRYVNIFDLICERRATSNWRHQIKHSEKNQVIIVRRPAAAWAPDRVAASLRSRRWICSPLRARA